MNYWADIIARDILEHMSDDDMQDIRENGSRSWREGVATMPLWTDDPEVSALSDDEKSALLDQILIELDKEANK